MIALHLVKTSDGAPWAFRQMRELKKLGVEVHVAVPPGGPMIDAYEKAGVVVHPLQTDFPVRAPHRLPGMILEFIRLTETIQPDVIHSHFVGTTLTMRLALGRRAKIPRLFQVPGPLHLEHPFFRNAELGAAGPPDFWIGSCRWTCDRYRQSGVAGDRVFLSYYGTDLDRFTPGRAGKLRSELNLGADVPLVGMVAYFYNPKTYLGQRRGLKGHEDLIDALAMCAGRKPPPVGVFVGGTWSGPTNYEESVRRYALDRLGERAVFLGTRSDVTELYPDFDVVVHPSLSENVGGAAESLLMRKPTVATSVGGFPDFVKPGETGWLVPPSDPPGVAAALDDALDHPTKADAYAENGWRLACRELDVRRTAAHIAEIYEIVKTKGGTSR